CTPRRGSLLPMPRLSVHHARPRLDTRLCIRENVVSRKQPLHGRSVMLHRLLAAAALVGLAVGAPPAIAAGKTICFVTFSLQIAYFQSSVAGGKKAAGELGVDLVVLDPQADAGRQVTQVEDCISRNVNAIVVDPIESSSLLGVLAEAGKRKIPVATLDTKVDSPDVVTLIGVPQREASYTFGQFVA